jgi:ketosteroid isomerase-like protein
MRKHALALTGWLVCIASVYVARAAPTGQIASSTDCRDGLQVAQRFVRDMRTKDIIDVLSLYTADAAFIQPDGSRVVGRSALRALYKTVFATYDSELASRDFEIEPVDDSGSGVCVQSGPYEETLRLRRDGTQMTVHGTYRFTYRRTSRGKWLISEMNWTMAASA